MNVLLAAPIDGHSQLYIVRALYRSGHIVEQFDYRVYAEMKGVDEMNDLFVIKKRGADLTLVLKGEIIKPQNLERTVLWNFDSWYAKDPSLLNAAVHARLFLTPSDGLVPYYKEQGINAHYLPEAADPELHRPLGDFMTESQKQTYGSDVSFIGTVDGVLGRDEWLYNIGRWAKGEGLPDTQWLLKIWGSFPGKLSEPWHTGQRADGDAAHNCIVSASKVNLDRTRTPYIEGAVSARVYRTLAAGGFMLMAHQTNLSNYLPIGTVGVYPDDNQCVSAILHFLNEPEERIAIAKMGYDWVLKKGTWDQRIQELLKLV